MARHADSGVIDTALQQLSESGFAHMAGAVRILLNEAMKIEPSHVLGAAPYERSQQRQG